jgi:DUF1009 family protein
VPVSGHPVGLIAGSGRFPLLWARGAKQMGWKVVAVAHTGETDPEIERIADTVIWVRLGELGKIIDAFTENGVSEAALAGGIRKKRIFVDARPDWRALALIARVANKGDDALLRALSDELAASGVRIRESTEFLTSLLTPDAVLTRRTPTDREEKDIAFGWNLAKEIGRLEIGQCVVVKDRTVLAVEAIEGTDEAIRRGGALGGGGAVVVKVSKAHQDIRFDLPAVGPDTVSVMAESGASVLALEAGRSVMLEREAMIGKADQLGISIIGLKR